MKKTMFTASLIATLVLLTGQLSLASDHDDGENDKKARALNLTDLYVFKESTQISGGSANHLVFIMNSNPRSLPRQQYYFSTNARYDFRISRIGTNNAAAVTGANDIILRFEFGAPSAGVQPITLTVYKDGIKTVKTTDDSAALIRTTTLAGAASVTNNAVTVDGQVLNIFAGLREDPFFFDVTAFFKFRSTLSGYPATTPTDFTANYNVNSIVVRVPIAFLQTSAAETVFDTWTTISVPAAN
jgi:hypothetical protein